MIFVQGWIRLAGSDDVESILPAVHQMAEATLTEPGCIAYSFAIDVSDPQLIQLNERWVSEEALQQHFQTPHMAEFNKAVSSLNIKSMDVRMYSGDEVRIMMQS